MTPIFVLNKPNFVIIMKLTRLKLNFKNHWAKKYSVKQSLSQTKRERLFMKQTTFSISSVPALIAILVTSLSFSSALQASTTNHPDTTRSKPKVTRGASMDSVEKRLGTPQKKHATIGNPPITRWDYASYSVFFEHSHVLHIVDH